MTPGEKLKLIRNLRKQETGTRKNAKNYEEVASRQNKGSEDYQTLCRLAINETKSADNLKGFIEDLEDF